VDPKEAAPLQARLYVTTTSPPQVQAEKIMHVSVLVEVLKHRASAAEYPSKPAS
jgi:hypothetical protein